MVAQTAREKKLMVGEDLSDFYKGAVTAAVHALFVVSVLVRAQARRMVSKERYLSPQSQRTRALAHVTRTSEGA